MNGLDMQLADFKPLTSAHLDINIILCASINNKYRMYLRTSTRTAAEEQEKTKLASDLDWKF
jgi:hypothetical protein